MTSMALGAKSVVVTLLNSTKIPQVVDCQALAPGRRAEVVATQEVRKT
jgi:hypothetical protein